MKARTMVLIFALITVVLLAMQCTSGTPQTPAPQMPAQQTSAPAVLDGKALVQERCAKCHSLARIEKAKKSADEWKVTVERMVSKGAELSADELAAVVDYLAKTYPK